MGKAKGGHQSITKVTNTKLLPHFQLEKQEEEVVNISPKVGRAVPQSKHQEGLFLASGVSELERGFSWG